MSQKLLFPSLFLAGLLLTLLVFPAAAQTEAFTETFDDSQLPGWEHSPEVIVSQGVLRIGMGNFAARHGAWQDFDLFVKMRHPGQGAAHVNFRANDLGSYLLVLTSEQLELLKTQEGGEPAQLTSAASPLESGEWTEIKITAQGNELSVSLDGVTLMTASDPDPLGPGAVIFAAHTEQALELDDFQMQPIEGAAAAGPAAEPAALPTPIPTTAPVVNSWQALLSEFSAAQGSPIESRAFFINLLLAVVTSFILSRVYIYWGSSLSNRRKFAANFMLVTVTTTFIILIVRSSVALSLGLVGALSIIRFRAAIKDPEELAYLFFAISLGIGLGDNQRAITIIALLVVVALIGLSHFFRQAQADMNLHLALTSRNPHKVELPQVAEVLQKHVAKLRLLRYDENDSTLEMSYVVEFRHASDLTELRKALLALSPSLEVSFLDNKGVW